MPASSTSPRVLILGGDVRWNRGDRAIRAALTDLLRGAWPAVQLFVCSGTPERDAREFGVETVAPSPWRLLRRRKFLRNLDLVLWGGGHLLQDDSSRLKNLYWAATLGALRRRTTCPFVGVGLGFGPINTALGRREAARALASLDRLLVRDAASAGLARELAPALESRVAPDPAVFLTPVPAAAAREYLRAQEGLTLAPGTRVIGVALRRWFHLQRNVLPIRWTHPRGSKPSPEYHRFSDNLAQALNRFATEQSATVLLFSMYVAPWEGDDAEARRLAAALTVPAHVLRLDCDPRLFKAVTGLCDLFLGVRLHACLLALGMGVPALSLAYATKSREFYHEAGLEGEIMDMHAAAAPDGAEVLLARLRALEAGRMEVAGRITQYWRTLTPEPTLDVLRDALAAGRRA